MSKAKPYKLRMMDIRRLLGYRQRKLAGGTASRYLKSVDPTKIACRHCGKDLKIGDMAYPSTRGGMCTAKLYCETCAKLLHIA